MEEKEDSITWQTKLMYGLVGIVVFVVATYLYNSRGGKFLVYACNTTANKCYTVEAQLDRESKSNKNATLYLEDGTVDVYCENEFGCSADGNSWSINKVRRL